MNVEKIMSSRPVTIGKGASLDRATELMEEHDVRHLPVLDDSGLCGMLSDRDLLEATGWLHPHVRRYLDEPLGEEADAGDAMSTPVVGVAPSDGLEDALGLMVQKKIGCLPVLTGTELVGVVTEMDVLASYADACRIGRLSVSDEPLLESLMSRDVDGIAPDADGAEAARALAESTHRHLPVLEDGRLIGILSDRDIRRLRGQGALETTLVRETMSTEPATARPTDRLSRAALLLSAERISALPVLGGADGTEVLGIVTLVDVMIPCAEALRQLD